MAGLVEDFFDDGGGGSHVLDHDGGDGRHVVGAVPSCFEPGLGEGLDVFVYVR